MQNITTIPRIRAVPKDTIREMLLYFIPANPFPLSSSLSLRLNLNSFWFILPNFFSINEWMPIYFLAFFLIWGVAGYTYCFELCFFHFIVCLGNHSESVQFFFSYSYLVFHCVLVSYIFQPLSYEWAFGFSYTLQFKNAIINKLLPMFSYCWRHIFWVDS